MVGKKITIRKLNITPFFIAPSDLNYPVSHPRGLLLYKVEADKKMFSKGTYPFRPTDDMFIRRIDWKAPIYAGEYWFVRRVLNFVIWCGSYIHYSQSFRRENTQHGPMLAIPSRQFYVFDEQQYTRELTHLYLTYAAARSDIPQPQDYTFPASIPYLSQNELYVMITKIVRMGYEDNFIYCDPEIGDDKTGAKCYRRLYRGLHDDPTLNVCEPPAKAIKLTFGVGLEESFEFHWFIGSMGDEIAVQFPKSKYSSFDFPLWVTGPAIREAFEPLFS